MTTRTIDLAYTSLSLDEILAELQDDQTEILLLRGEKPLARLLPIASSSEQGIMSSKRIMGLHRGETWISDDFNDALPDEFWLGSNQ
ncbi:MAG: toxin-antitoxin (TA) system antitoxin [Anaerolineae bacterium]|nr:toxin-antitoxin (TA) system antitoxin [Anaerolineae bacterium]